MKKSNKILLITGLATVTIGTAGILHTNYTQNQRIGSEEIKAYNHQPANILDNVFMQDNIKYLPFIFDRATENDNITPKKISKDDIVAAFQQKGLTIKNISTGEKIVTGTQITVQENSEVYNVVIYGDINADGQVNVLDIQKIIRHVIYMGEHELKGTYKIAANLQNSDGDINVLDAQRIIRFCIDPEKNKILLNEPVSDKESDKTPPEITIKGQANIELEEGDTYNEEGVTAIDNYDGELTVADIQRIIQFKAEGSSEAQTVTDVDTSKIGTYTITYTATDSNGNSSSKTRTVIVKQKTIVDPPVPDAKVESIELVLAGNFKTQYQFGEATKLDLTGAQIKVNTDDGKTDTKNVTNSMLSSYDLTTEGTKAITVTYEGVTAANKIEVTVLKKISELVMNNTGMNNVQTIESGYQTNSKEDFILGTIQAKQEDGGSTLQQSQLKVTSTVVATTDSTVTANDLTISFEADADGNILVKGKAEKVGDYTIKVYIEYGSQKVEKTLQLNVKKSDVVGQVIVAPTEENEIIKIGKAAKRKLTVINVNEEEINVPNGNIEITPIEGITIDRLNESGGIIAESDKFTVVDSLQIKTTLRTAQTFTARMKVNGKDADFTFSIKDQSVISRFEITEDTLNVYTSTQAGNLNVVPGMDDLQGNIYTLIEPIFYDQYGEEMEVKATDIYDSTIADDVTAEAQSGKVAIQLPKADAFLNIPDVPFPVPAEGQVKAIDLQRFDANGNIEEKNSEENSIAKIGFSIILNDSGQTIDLSSLDGQQVIVKCGSQTKALTIKVNYKALTNLNVNTTTASIEKDDEDYYVASLNQDFTLGIVSVGKGETPVTADMLETVIDGDSTGIKITYVEDEDNGDIVIHGRVSKEGTYQITPKVKNGVAAKINIQVRGVSIPIINEDTIQFASPAIQIGEASTQDLVVTSNIEPTNQPIKAKDITFTQETQSGVVNDLNIELLDERNAPILLESSGNTEGGNNTTPRPDEIVKKIKITAKSTITEEKDIKLTMILFAGQENQAKKEVTISVYKPIPRRIETSDTITLYNTHIEGTTVQEGGLVYTLIPVELYADNTNTRKINASKNLFTTVETEKQNKVFILQEKVYSYIDIGEGIEVPSEDPVAVLDIKYFDANKDITDENVKYIGVAMLFNYHKEDLTKIDLYCEGAEDTPSKTITINYSEN